MTNRATSPICEACEEGAETVDHYIYDCPARMSERRQLRKAAGRNWANKAYLLGDKKGVTALMAYVRATGRMRWGRSEENSGRPEDQQGERETDGDTGSGENAEDEDSEAEVERLVDGQGGTDGEERREETDVERFMRWLGTNIGGGRLQDETQRERNAATRADQRRPKTYVGDDTTSRTTTTFQISRPHAARKAHDIRLAFSLDYRKLPCMC